MWWLSLVPWRMLIGGVLAVFIAGMFGWNVFKNKKIDKLEAEIAAAEQARQIAPILQEQGRNDERIQSLERKLAVIVDNQGVSDDLVRHPSIVEFFNRVYNTN